MTRLTRLDALGLSPITTHQEFLEKYYSINEPSKSQQEAYNMLSEKKEYYKYLEGFDKDSYSHFDLVDINYDDGLLPTRKSYSRLVAKLHPETREFTNGGELYDALNISYSYVSDSALRKSYLDQLKREHPNTLDLYTTLGLNPQVTMEMINDYRLHLDERKLLSSGKEKVFNILSSVHLRQFFDSQVNLEILSPWHVLGVKDISDKELLESKYKLNLELFKNDSEMIKVLNDAYREIHLDYNGVGKEFEGNPYLALGINPYFTTNQIEDWMDYLRDTVKVSEEQEDAYYSLLDHNYRTKYDSSIDFDSLNYYDFLGIPRLSDMEFVLSSYRALNKVLHPMHNYNAVESVANQKVTEAYGLLSDEVKKRGYDSSLQHNRNNSVDEETTDSLTNPNIYNPYVVLGLTVLADIEILETYIKQITKRTSLSEEEQKAYEFLKDESRKSEYDRLNNKPSLYSILGIEDFVGDIELGAKRNSRATHPDIYIQREKDTQAIFIEITKAKEILSNPDEKAHYDSKLKEDLAKQMNLSLKKSNMFTEKNFNNSVEVNGANFTATKTITFKESLIGGKFNVTIKVPSICPSCDGTKKKTNGAKNKCGSCDGSGKIIDIKTNPFGKEQKTVKPCLECNKLTVQTECDECDAAGQIYQRFEREVILEHGVNDGDMIRLQGYGSKGLRGGKDGDLLVTIKVEHSTDYTFDEDENVLTTLPLTYPQLVLGDTVSVWTPHGDKEIEVPALTQPGKQITIKNAGKTLQGQRASNMVILITLKMPDQVTEELASKLRNL